MEALEMTGRTVEEAIEKALKQLGVEREDVEIVVVDEGRAGILGLGSQPALVRVQLRSADVVDLAKETIEGLLRAMGVAAFVSLPERSGAGANEGAEGALSFNIDGEDAGLLIGRRGETLAAIQFLVSLILSRRLHGRANISIDVERYRERRAENLRAMANRMAERVAATGRTITLEPMPARDRRLVHIALASHPKVTTESVGEGEARMVTIIPKRGPRSPVHYSSRPAP